MCEYCYFVSQNVYTMAWIIGIRIENRTKVLRRYNQHLTLFSSFNMLDRVAIHVRSQPKCMPKYIAVPTYSTYLQRHRKQLEVCNIRLDLKKMDLKGILKHISYVFDTVTFMKLEANQFITFVASFCSASIASDKFKCRANWSASLALWNIMQSTATFERLTELLNSREDRLEPGDTLEFKAILELEMPLTLTNWERLKV